MAIGEISVVPASTQSPSVSQHVARAIETLKGNQGTRHELIPVGTIIEGDLRLLMGLVRSTHENAFTAEVMRVATTVKFDERRHKSLPTDRKLDSLGGGTRIPLLA